MTSNITIRIFTIFHEPRNDRSTESFFSDPIKIWSLLMPDFKQIQGFSGLKQKPRSFYPLTKYFWWTSFSEWVLSFGIKWIWKITPLPFAKKLNQTNVLWNSSNNYTSKDKKSKQCVLTCTQCFTDSKN